MRCRALLLVLVLLLQGCTPDREGATNEMTAGGLMGESAAAGFARATEPRRFAFPTDHGPHPDYQTEWWYLTGNLEDDQGARFGFQVTFFRFALTPDNSEAASPWRTRDAWMAHFAITDAEGGIHHKAERFSRGAVGLAGARAKPFAVWLDDWRLAADPDSPDTWHLEAQAEGFGLRLALSSGKPPVLQGDAGLSRKSAEPGNASYYYSLTRLAAAGEVRLGQRHVAAEGSAWMDREWSTSALSREQAGWDWFALQLQDGHELMFYRLRLRDGETDPHSAGTLVGPDATVIRLDADDVELTPLSYWSAPDGRRYPVEWRMRLPARELSWQIRPVLDDQEMALSVRYWEGAVDVLGENGTPIGVGYIELAGYD